MGDKVLFAVLMGISFVVLSWLYEALPEHRTLLLLVTVAAMVSGIRRAGRSSRREV